MFELCDEQAKKDIRLAQGLRMRVLLHILVCMVLRQLNLQSKRDKRVKLDRAEAAIHRALTTDGLTQQLSITALVECRVGCTKQQRIRDGSVVALWQEANKKTAAPLCEIAHTLYESGRPAGGKKARIRWRSRDETKRMKVTRGTASIERLQYLRTRYARALRPSG